MTEGVAEAAGVPVADVRRAAMLAGGAIYVVDAAFAGRDALAGIGLTVGRPIQPMLASSAPDLDAAIDKVGATCPASRSTRSSTASGSRCTAGATTS